MVLLDEVCAADASRIRCRAKVRPGGPFVEGGSAPALLAIEYMAQAIAAFSGLQRVARSEPVRVGYVLGTRELRLEVASFAVGQELSVEAEHLFGDEQLGSFRCSVAVGGRVVASADVNVYLRNDGREIG
jgi:predicted hotdog family 3-hydroxylacyl-ACP dehydratase